jgi:allose kinase
MSYNNKEYVLGVDIGGTYTRLGMLTKDGHLHNVMIKRTKEWMEFSKPLNGLDKVLFEYYQLIISEGTMLAISIGLPSIISKDKKMVLSTPNMPGFNNINIVDPLERLFHVPVFIENDVNFLLLKEIVDRKLSNTSIIVGFYIGTGFGNSIFINGKFLVGHNGVAAELGHIPVLGRNDICSCGNPGCVEQYASGTRLQKIKQEFFPECEIQDIFTKHKSSETLCGFIDALSIPIATVINILDPDHIIIGGGVVNMDCFPKEDLDNYIYLHTRKPLPAENLNITYAEDSQTSGIIGAGYHAFRMLSLSPPTMDDSEATSHIG